MLRPHELNVDFMVLVPTRSASIDEQLDVNAFLVHVMDASVHVPVVAVQARILTPHESAVGPARCGTRLCLTQRARDVCAPAADGVTAPEAEAPRVGWGVLKASRVSLVEHFTALQVWYELADTGREVFFEGVGPRPDVRIAVVDFVAISHVKPPLCALT